MMTKLSKKTQQPKLPQSRPGAKGEQAHPSQPTPQDFAEEGMGAAAKE